MGGREKAGSGGRLAGWCGAHPVVAYCLLAFTITWGSKLLYAWVRARWGMPVFNFGLVAQFGPSIAAFFLIGLTEGREGLRRTCGSLVGWRVGAGWLAFAALFEFSIFFGISALYRLQCGPFPAGEVAVASAVWGLLATFAVGLFRWGLAEEVGWHGWMLPKLQRGLSPFAATMVMALVTTLWHIPPDELWRIASAGEGKYLAGLYSDAGERLAITVPIELVLTYFYNRTRGNLLVQVFFHSASNTSYFWVKENLGIVGTDFFKASFLVVLVAIGAVFSLLVIRQREGVLESR